jgi:PAS domain S-box-containing protein
MERESDMRSTPPEAGRLERYGIALLAVAVAFVATHASWPLLEPTPWALCFAAVMASAWFGGQGPSLVATALMAVLGHYYFIDTPGTFALGPSGLIPTLVFVGVSLFIGFLSSDRRRAEGFERAERRRFQATVTSIGDAVIATDAGGRVTFMNGIAEMLTGWGLAEAAGRRLEDIFVIVNQETREPAPNPVATVLETGRIQRLANHTVLIARDGTERPIDDSAAPIADDRGEMLGVVLVFRDVAEKYESARRLRESEEFNRRVIASSPDCLKVLDIEGRLLSMNERGCRLMEIDDFAPCASREWAEFWPEGSREQIRAALATARGGQVATFRGHAPTAKGTWKWWDVSVSPIFDANGKTVQILSVSRDITDRTEAENRLIELREQERAAGQRTRTVLESISDAFFAVGADWRFHYVNPQAEEVLGRRPGDLLGRDLWEEYPGLAGSEFERAYRRTAGERVASSVTAYYADHDRWYEVRVYPAEDGGISVYFRDVSRRERLAEEHRRLDEKRWLALESAQLGSWNFDPAAESLECDERFREMFGLAEGRASFQDAMAKIHPEDRGRVSDAIAAGTRPDDPQPYSIEYRVVRPDGSVRWVAAKGRANFKGEGASRRAASFDGTVADVTDRVRAEEATRRRAFQLQKLADIASRINSAHDVNSVLGVVTWEARSLFDAHQAATSMVLDPHHPQPINVVSNSEKYPHGMTSPDIDALGFYEAIKAANEPIRLTRAELDAEPRWGAIRRLGGVAPSLNGWLAAPLVGRNGRSMGIIQLSDKAEGEFTEDDEAMLLQLSRLAAIAVQNARLYQELRTNDARKDEFLAMLAHELRNPLAAIGNAVKLTSKTGLREHMEWSMDVITRQMGHLSRLIDDLLDVSRITRGKIELKRAVMDLIPILESAEVTVRALVEERKHTVEVDIERGNLWANIDPTRLEQVVVNLLNNAAKYSENAGHIRLSARNDAGEVVISIKDRGVGIPPEKLPEMFELFAQGDRSLARSEGGLGIGLTVVKKLVEMHGGTIAATSEGAGKGSEFVIRLPSATRPAEARPATPGPAEKPSTKSRILVVDDNFDTARGMSRLLKLIGHEVATAHSGPEAIELAREFQPEVILLDIGLPGMSGYEVASQLRREECCKDALIVAVSGYGQDDDRRRSRESGFDYHLTKPLDHDALLTLLSTESNGKP